MCPDFPDSSVGKESVCNAGDPGSIPGLERSTAEGIGYTLQYSWAYLVAQLVKNLPAMWETWVQSLCWEDPWRRERLPMPVFWLREFHGLYLWGHKESDMVERLSLSYLCPGEGNGNPPQCSCLENLMDRGTWRATVHGVAKSWTRLKN